jgi:RHS repeat-associated protein
MYNRDVTLNPSCTYTAPQDAGSYAQPFSLVAKWPGYPRHGQVRYTPKNFANTKRLVYTYLCPGSSTPIQSSKDIYKEQTVVCPLGFDVLEGFSSIGEHPTDWSGANIISDVRCRPALSPPVVTFKMKLTCSPAAGENPHPCHPATGDKSREEFDFSFAGVPFARYYHSLRQTGTQPYFAPGWTHTFSDRIFDGGQWNNMRMFRGDGYIEYFWDIGNNIYKSSLSSRRKLVKFANGTYRVYDESGRILWFNSAGRLVKDDRSELGLQSIDFAYDGDRLIQASDQNGRVLNFVYVANRLSTIELPDGGLLEYEFDSAGNFERAIYPDGSTKQYHYNESGLSLANDRHALTGITAESGERYASFGYAANGRVNLSRLHKGDGTYVDQTTIDYANVNAPVVTLPHGETLTYGLQQEGGYTRITSVVSGGGAGLYSYYTGTGSGPSTTVALSGRTTKHNYGDAYETSRYEAFGTPDEKKITTSRNADYRIVQREISAKVGSTYVAKQQVSSSYNSRGQRLTATVTDPATSSSRTTGFSYCEQADVDGGMCPLVGLLKQIDGPRADVADITSFQYRAADDPQCAVTPASCEYRKGDLWKVTNALGHLVTVLGSDGAGRPRRIQDSNGVVAHVDYDLRGRPTAYKLRGSNDASETDDRITLIEYWPTGLVKKVTHSDGAISNYAYDDALRLTSITDGEGNRIDLTLNAASRLTKKEIRDPGGVLMSTVSRTYNSINRLQSMIDAYGRATTFSYDSGKYPDIGTDALGRSSDSNYDVLGRLARVLRDVSGVAAETTYGYDVLDNVVRVTDPKGLDTTYAYNGLGDLTQQSSPDTGVSQFGYDAAGNLATRTDARGVTSTFAYDALNRVTTVSYPASALDIAYTYDVPQGACATGETYGTGRLAKMTDASGETVYCYDRFGNLVRKVQVTNGKTFVLRYQFNVAGRLTGIVYPDGTVVDYVHGASGRVTEVGVQAAGGSRQVVAGGIAYYPFGPVGEWTYGNGRKMTRSLNQNYEPGFVEVTGQGGLSIGYEFDAIGNLKKLRGADQSDPATRVFGYDGLNRLAESRDGVSNALIEGYTYDKTGNRSSATDGSVSTAYDYATGNHRLAATGAIARGYDAVGNTLQIGGATRQFVYDDRNRMSQYLESGVVKMNYVYNARGEQVRKHVSGTSTYALYDDGGRWVGEYDDSGAPSQQVVWLGALPIAVLEGSGGTQKLYYVEADALGTPRVVVDPTRGSTGTPVWRWELAGNSFGSAPPNQDPDGDTVPFVFNMRFPGQRYDSVSGLNQNYFRDYDASTGRYVQSDPIGLLGGISTFAYAGSAPLTQTDPFGLIVDSVTATCRRDLAFCADLFGDMASGYAGVQRSLGYDCVAEPFEDISDALHKAAQLRELIEQANAARDMARGRRSFDSQNLRPNNSPFDDYRNSFNGRPNRPDLPHLDGTGKVHGELPRLKDLSDYSHDELADFRNDLTKSVQRRIEATVEHGRDRAHGQRQGAEQDLIKRIDRILENVDY